MDDPRVRAAGLGRRIVAGLVDTMLWTAILVVAALRFGTHATGPGGSTISLTGAPFLVYAAAYLAYYALSEWLWGRTLGKWLLGLRVVSAHGGRVSLGPAVIRNVFRLVDGFPYIIPYLVGLLAVAASPSGQRIGDLVARTRVGR